METLALTAHICVDSENVLILEEVMHAVQLHLKDLYHIDHSTLQVEHSPCSSCYHSRYDGNAQCAMCIDCSLKKRMTNK